jgi:glycerol kinase
MQFQCDILQTPVVRPKVYETTALGAAYLAGLAVGYWGSVHELQKQWQEDMRFKPEMPEDVVRKLRGNWQRAVNASISWADEKVPV